MPNLRLVQPVAPAVHQPSVLTPSFEQRLAVLNRAIRALRDLGLRVVWTRLAGPLPQVHINRDCTQSISPLLDRMGPRSFRTDEGYTMVSGEFEGVIVTWAEPQAH